MSVKLTRQKVGLVSLFITALASGSAAKAQHRAQDDLYIICYAAFQNGSPNFNHINIREVPMLKVNKGAIWPNAGNDRLARSLKQKMVEMLGPNAINRAACTTYIFESQARNSRERNALQIEWPFDPMEELNRFVDADYPGRPKTKAPSRTDQKPKATETASVELEPAASPPKYVEVAGPNGKMRLSPEVAARNQAAAEEYRRKVDEHARTMAAHDQTLAQHQQNAAKAASAKERHDQEVAAAAERAAAHRLALAEHAKKVAAASTNEDPNRCITSPEIKPGLRGNTEVHVTNGCDQKVDIVICLKRTSGDWLCGARFGILSQRSMSFMSTNATGEIYVDAVTFGSNNKLGRPAGIIK